jgi:NAD+ kinase
MKSNFRRVALFGKYQASAFGGSAVSPSATLREIAQFLVAQGCDVVIEQQTLTNAELTEFTGLDIEAIGHQCDLAVVVGGDGTMLGISRQLAPYGVPLIGINQGRLGFITDIPLESYQATLAPMLAGEYEDDHRSLMHAKVMRDGVCVFDATAMNDVVVNRGATSGMVELALRVQPALRWLDHRHADGLDGLCAVGRRAAHAPVRTGLGAGADCTAYAVEPPTRLGRPSRSRHRAGVRA